MSAPTDRGRFKTALSSPDKLKIIFRISFKAETFWKIFFLTDVKWLENSRLSIVFIVVRVY